MTTTSPNSSAPALPQDSGTLLYDGECVFCRRQIERIKAWDGLQQQGRGRFQYLSLHAPEVQERWPDLSRDRLMQEMCIIDPQDHRHWGAEAVRYITRVLPRLWWAAPFTHFPGAMLVLKPLYGLVSKYRYRLMGRTQDACESGSCSLHR